MQLYFVRDDSLELRKRKHITFLIDAGEIFFFKGQKSEYTFAIKILSCILKIVEGLLTVYTKDMVFLNLILFKDRMHRSNIFEIQISKHKLADLIPTTQITISTISKDQNLSSLVYNKFHKPCVVQIYDTSPHQFDESLIMSQILIPLDQELGIVGLDTPLSLRQKIKAWTAAIIKPIPQASL